MADGAYDYIIVGAGSAGSALAARLTEDASVRVLLLEAGRGVHPLSRLPVSFSMFIDNPAVNWCYLSEPEPGTDNRQIPVPRGKMLGGSSAINGLVFVRGQPLDYDTWAQMGCRGWSWQDVLPVFQRMETYENRPGGIRGGDGPLHVSEVPDQNPLYDALFAAAEAAGFKRNADYNGEDQEGVVKTQTTIRRGRRMSTAHCYLRPAMRRANLRVVTEALTLRVLLEGSRCVGVEYAAGGQTVQARAGREVVLCAGAVSTPQILELSGIGRPAVLQEHGIPVLHELAAVGENFRDHLNARIQWRVKDAAASYNTRVKGLGLVGEIAKYAFTGGGFLSLPSAPLLAFLRTRPELETPDVQMHMVPYAVKNPKKRQLHDFPGMTIACYQLRPESLGSIHIRSADPRAQPAIRFNFLGDAIDRRATVDGFRMMRRIVGAAPMDRYRGEEFSPGEDVRSDDDILTWIRGNAQTAYHPIGTCRMGPGPNTVVDERLRVHGLQGLRVADASVFPTMPSGNTNAPSILVGEKAADLVRAGTGCGDGMSEIDDGMLAAAEALMGVQFSDAERAQMRDNISGQIELAIRRRALRLPNALPPASLFDPRLRGFTMPAQSAMNIFRSAPALPAADEDIAFAPVRHLSAWIAGGQLTSVRLTGIYLDRIRRLNPMLLCFAAVPAEAALAAAKRADEMLAAGAWRGPLHGIPYGAKDILDTAGITTGWGAEPYADRVPDADAHVIRRLADAGAVLLGKTSVGALAFGDIWYGGQTRNPWNIEEGSRGSSAGSASATAAGLVGFAIGTETLGSIIAPCARCGTTGLRPTFGRVSRAGAMSLCWSLDKIGPICRGVDDTALVLDAINGFDAADEGSIAAPFGWDATRSVVGMRVGYIAADFADPLDRAALDAVRGLGAAVVAVELADLPYESLRNLMFAEAAAAFEEITLDDTDDLLARQDPGAWPNSFRKARFLSAVDHIQLDRLRRRVMQEMDALFRRVDVLLSPAAAERMTTIGNMTGHPCLTIRAGFTEMRARQMPAFLHVAVKQGEGPLRTVPHPITIVAPLFDEAAALTLGRALEVGLGVAERRPDFG